MSVLNQLSKECHSANQHWWHNPATGEHIERNKDQLIMLIVSEIAEAMEGERKGLVDDHLPRRKMAEVELADELIRIFDYAGAYGYDLDKYVLDHDSLNDLGNKALNFCSVDDDRGAALMVLVRAAAALSFAEHGVILFHGMSPTMILANLIVETLAYASAYGYDMDAAVAEKLSYNAHRADHKPAARLAAGGKRW